MANVNAPFGFREYSGTGVTPSYEQVTLYNGGIDYNAAAIYFGDPVVRVGTGDGTIKQAAGSAGGSSVTMAGIFKGCKYYSLVVGRTVWSNYWPGGSPVTAGNQSTIEAYIINDPNAQFLVQSDSTGMAQADIGANVDFNIGTGNAANGLSGAYLIHTGSAATGFPFRFVGLVWFPPGANGVATSGAAAAYNYAVVAFANVETKTLTAVNT